MQDGHFFEGEDKTQESFGWTEFTLEELNLPPVSKILEGVKKIESEVGLQGWRTKGWVSENYKGFGITHNPTFFDKNENVHHQVLGSDLSVDYYSQDKGFGDHKQRKNTYYDTYGFRKIHPIIQKHLGFFLDRFNFHISRSRVAYIFGYGLEPNTDRGWHVDEATCKLLRVNIPLQTSDEYVMQWNNKTYKQELGKVYLWNTQKEHRPTMIKKVETKEPRINIVIGLVPWLDYNEETDSYSKNKYFGKPISEIVNEKLFVK